MSKLFFVHHRNVNQILKDPGESNNDKKIKEADLEIQKILKGIDNNNDPFIKALTRENNIKDFKGSFQDLRAMLKTNMKFNKQKDVVDTLMKKRVFSATQFKNDKIRNNVSQ